MKYNIHFLSRILILVMAMSITGCSKDDNNEIIINPPSVEGEQDYTDTLTIGQEMLLNPRFTNHKNAIYEWSVDGEIVSYDSTFVFTPEIRGNHNIQVSVENESGEASVNYDIFTWGSYENGFYLVNEGWFGHGTGTVSFYRYNTQQLEDSVYVKANPAKNLNPITSTLEYGTIYNEKLYLVSKGGGPMVVTDAYSLKEEQRIPAQPGNDWRAFLGVNETEGLLSSRDGLYRVDLQTLQIKNKISGISGQIGDMNIAGNYIFVLSQTQGAIILNASSYEIEKVIPGMAVGFAKTQDENVWVAGGTHLVRINSSTLDTEEIELSFEAYGSWGAWHPGSLTANEEAIFIAKNASFSGGSQIYKYDGDSSSLEEPFIILPESEILYGAGIGYNSETNQLVVNTVQEGWGENFSYNKLHFYDANSGNLISSESFTGYYFPAVPVFHE